MHEGLNSAVPQRAAHRCDCGHPPNHTKGQLMFGRAMKARHEGSRRCVPCLSSMVELIKTVCIVVKIVTVCCQTFNCGKDRLCDGIDRVPGSPGLCVAAGLCVDAKKISYINQLMISDCTTSVKDA